MPRNSMSTIFLVLSLILSSPLLSAAEPVTVIFVNGIQNSRQEARDSGTKIQQVLDASANHLDTRREFNVLVKYNPVGFTSDGSVACKKCQIFDDRKELFIQKTAEEHFASDFQKIIAPHNLRIPIDKDAALRIKIGFVDDLTPGGNSLEWSLPGRTPEVTDALMAPNGVVVQDIVNTIKMQVGPTILIGHSQGNLLNNLAFATLASEVGQEIRTMLRVVNVANTTQFAVSGLSFSHAKDAALFSSATDFEDADLSLETLPKQSFWLRNTPTCVLLCDFSVLKAAFGGVDRTDGTLDHAFVETYLSTTDLPVVLESQGVSFTPGKSSFVDRFEDFVYTAAFSLEEERDPPLPTSYSITPIGTYRPTGINDRGDVVGQCGDIACIRLATDGVWRSIGTLGGNSSRPYAISSNGQVVGQSSTEPYVGLHAFTYSGPPGTPLTDLAPLLVPVGTGHSEAVSISESGHIAGNVNRFDGSQRAFLLYEGQVEDLGNLPTHTSSLVSRVNNFGTVVGYAYTGAPITAFIKPKGGPMTTIAALAGMPSFATSINDAGVVVGSHYPYGNPIDYISFAYSMSTGAFTEIKDGNLYALVTAINNRGEIIGTKTSGTFIYKNGIMTDLNQLIPQDSGWWLTGDGLNNNLGQIVSSAVLNGQSQYVILTPIPPLAKVSAARWVSK